MTPAEQPRRRLLGLVLIQLLFTGLAFTGFAVTKDLGMAVAAGVGGIAATAGTVAGAWVAGLFHKEHDQNAGTALSALYQSALAKMAVSVALLVAGMVWFRSSPLAVVSGYLAAQAAYLFTRVYAPRRRG